MSLISSLLKSEFVSCNHVWMSTSPVLGLNPSYSIQAHETHNHTFGIFPGGLSGASASMNFSGQHGGPTIDARGHMAVNQTFFDGTPTSEGSDPTTGLLTKHGIDEFPENQYITRGVLVDLPYCLGGVGRLEPNTTVPSQQVIDCLEKENVTIQEGDSVLLRTGYGQLFNTDPVAYVTNWPGIGAETAQYLADQKVFLAGADNLGLDVVPSVFPAHDILLAQNGIFIVENINLELLAEKCKEHDLWEFALVVNPPKIQGAAAMAVNIFAILGGDDEKEEDCSGGTASLAVSLMTSAVAVWSMFAF